MIAGGVDLAFQDDATALCAIEWPKSGPPTMVTLMKGVSDDDILECVRRCERTAIDAPMGWPTPFVEFVAAHASNNAIDFPGTASTALWLRRTDQLMPLRPLSVAADKLAKPAARCAHLQSRLRDWGMPVDRTGLGGQVIEAYPAAALHIWGFTDPYKKASGTEKQALRRAARLKIATYLIAATGVGGVHTEDLIETDDHLDAFICALVARAAWVGEIANRPGPEDLDAARTEGWIHLPTADAPSRLF